MALYISLFPQLIAGPIVRYETISDAINFRTTSVRDFSQGAVRFIYGFGKKIIIANSMAVIAEKAFSTSPSALTSGMAWLGIFAYSLQIYYDFSGYSDMAIGLAKIFGFNFLENFNYPYISKSITEFWRRWHISLGTWFRDYVYIPLGGNKVSVQRHALNIFATWLLTGFWHGAAWNFIVWGLYFAVILMVEKLFLLKCLNNLWRPLAHFYAIILIIIGWVIFRSDSMAYAMKYLIRMFDLPSLLAADGQAYYYIIDYRFEWIAALIFSIPIGRLISGLIKVRESEAVFLIVKLFYVFAIFILSIIFLINSTFNPFIYFRF